MAKDKEKKSSGRIPKVSSSPSNPQLLRPAQSAPLLAANSSPGFALGSQSDSRVAAMSPDPQPPLRSPRRHTASSSPSLMAVPRAPDAPPVDDSPPARAPPVSPRISRRESGRSLLDSHDSPAEKRSGSSRSLLDVHDSPAERRAGSGRALLDPREGGPAETKRAVSPADKRSGSGHAHDSPAASPAEAHTPPPQRSPRPHHREHKEEPAVVGAPIRKVSSKSAEDEHSHGHKSRERDDSSLQSSSSSGKRTSIRVSAADDDSSVSSAGRKGERDEGSHASHSGATAAKKDESGKRHGSHRRSKSVAITASNSAPPQFIQAGSPSMSTASLLGSSPTASPSLSSSASFSPSIRTAEEKLARQKRRLSTNLLSVSLSKVKEPRSRDAKIVLVQSLVRRWLMRRRYKRVLKKKRVVEEMWTTEKVYVERLSVVCELYLKPLLRATTKSGAPLLRRDQAQLIFCNVEAIHAHHRRFFGLLSLKVAKWNLSARLGELYLSTDWVTLYRDFTEGKALSQRTLRELRQESAELDAWLKARETQQTLASMLILPVQRITRYVLLLGEALKNTEASAEDYADLQRAAKHLNEACARLEDNSMQREDDKLRVGALLSLQRRFDEAEVKADPVLSSLASSPTRKIIKELEAQELDLGDGKAYDRVYILLSDVLLLARPLGGKKLSLVRSAMLAATNMSSANAEQLERRFSGRAPMALEFSCAPVNKPFVLALRSVEEREALKKATNAAILALSEAALGGKEESWF